MKYEATGGKIRLPDRKALNQRCLAALDGDGASMPPAEIFHSYTGIGGLHGLHYVDYANYHDFSEAKKEIEQGQFFTPDALCAWVVDCIRPDERQKIADLTCGKGSFFNHLLSEEKIYGCEIEPDSYKVAHNLFPDANLTLGDVRSYNPGVFFHLVIGNPPYHLHWIYNGKKASSQTAYILKAAELLYPGGLLAVIVPASLFGESTPKIETKRIYQQFNHVVQVALDPNAFSALGVMNFPTKLLILQRKAAALPDVPHDPEVVEQASSENIYYRYVYPALEAARQNAPEIQLQINRAARAKEEITRKEEALLYQIRIHPCTSSKRIPKPHSQTPMILTAICHYIESHRLFLFVVQPIYTAAAPMKNSCGESRGRTGSRRRRLLICKIIPKSRISLKRWGSRWSTIRALCSGSRPRTGRSCIGVSRRSRRRI